MLWWLPLAALAAPRPVAAAWADASSSPVRCHVERAGDVWRCADVFAATGAIWEPAFGGPMGLTAPLPDGDLGGSDTFDVYLTYEAAGAGAMAVACDGEEGCDDVDPEDGVYGASAWMSLDARTDEASMARLVTAGLVRASWMGVDAAETAPAFVAGTSALVAQRLSADRLPPVPAVQDYQSFPWASALLQGSAFLYEEHGFWSDYDSGAWLWAASLEGFDAGVDVSATRAVWWAGVQEGPENEPDVLDAWAAVTGVDWTDAFLAFSSERARLGTDKAPAWMPEVDPRLLAWREGALAAPADLRPAFPPHPLGVSMWDVRGAMGHTLAFDLSSDADTRWAFVFVDPTGLTTTALAEEGEQGLHATYTPAGEGVVTVIVANLGPEGFDAEGPLDAAAFALTVRPYSGQLGGDPEPTSGTCGCSGGPGAASGLLLVPWLRRRRQRAQPRSCGSSLP